MIRGPFASSRRASGASFALLALLALICAPAAHAQPAAANPSDSLDAAMHRVARDVPEFGGAFRDSDGRLAVYLTNGAMRDRAQAALERELGPGIASSGVRVLQGRFGFHELARIHARVTPALASAGVTMTDIDEAHNTVTVGVERSDDVDRVVVDLLAFGAPDGAFRVVVTGPIRPAATLRDRIRAVAGGLQIQFGGYLCTAGFVAVRAGVRGFVTNSHCTGQYGGVTSTVYYQPIRASGNRIGVETVDPSFAAGGGCPAGKVCRYSDSAFVRFDAAVTSARGRIARPAATGSITLDPVTPAFRVASEASAPLVGETLNKVGRTTGWSRGTVLYTCVTTYVSGTNRALYCQDFVRARVAAGDSGSPVFKVTASPDRVRLYGVLWGSANAGSVFVFSRLANIQRDLGTLTTCDPALAPC